MLSKSARIFASNRSACERFSASAQVVAVRVQEERPSVGVTSALSSHSWVHAGGRKPKPTKAGSAKGMAGRRPLDPASVPSYRSMRARR